MTDRTSPSMGGSSTQPSSSSADTSALALKTPSPPIPEKTETGERHPLTNTPTLATPLSATPVAESSDSDFVVEIENASDMASSYVRTRHKNMRCFPRCSAIHKTKSFCGQSLYVAVKGKVLRKEDVIIVGEFRNTRVHPSFAVGQTIPSTEFNEAFTEGVLLRQTNDVMSFAINPIRKWKFDGKLRPMDHYVFTVFLVIQGKVVATKDTPSFSIIPIWKLPGEEDEGGEEETLETKKKMTVAKPAKKLQKRYVEDTASSSSARTHEAALRYAMVPPPPPPHPQQQQSGHAGLSRFTTLPPLPSFDFHPTAPTTSVPPSTFPFFPPPMNAQYQGGPPAPSMWMGGSNPHAAAVAAAAGYHQQLQLVAAQQQQQQFMHNPVATSGGLPTSWNLMRTPHPPTAAAMMNPLMYHPGMNADNH